MEDIAFPKRMSSRQSPRLVTCFSHEIGKFHSLLLSQSIKVA